MLTRPCADRDPLPGRRRGAISLIRCLPAAFAVALLFSPIPADAETVVLNVVLNQENKGEYFVERTDDGDFLVKAEDLKDMGFRDPAGTVAQIGGVEYVSLRSIGGVRFVLDEQTLSLLLTAFPELLPTRIIDFQPKRQPKVSYPRDTGGFLNYGFGYSTADSFRTGNVDATGQIGVRSGDTLFLTDASYLKTPEVENFVRLMSSATIDHRGELRRIVLGDFFASSGILGGNLNLGGASVSKVYRIDPYFVRYPLANFSGLVSAPSEAEIIINGIRVRKEKLSPGSFGLANIPNYGGASDISVVIKDPFGRERTLTYPFYFTDQLLRKGLHEYSYNAGFLREEFGAASNRYGRPAVSAFHRYGWNDSLTLGGRAEGGDGAYNLGPDFVALVPGAGVLSGGISASMGEGKGAGLAGLLSHSYQDNTIGTRLIINAFSREYAFIAGETDTESIRYRVGAGISYGSRVTGSISLDYARSKKHVGQDTESISLAYSRNIGMNISLLGSLMRLRGATSETEAFLGLTYTPRPGLTAAASYQRTGDRSVETVQAQKSPPVGEGFGLRASLERMDVGESSSTIANPFVQYNSRYGIYSAEYRGDVQGGSGSVQSYRFAASGAVAAVGGAVGFSRPIADSFGLVRVDDLKGVRVYQSNQEVGRTDAKGEVFVPNLASYYENEISIEPKDIPMEFMISDVTRYVSPPLRSGSVVRFESKRFQAVTGYLKALVGGVAKPVEYSEGRILIDGQETPFPTARRGEFYIEYVPPGTYGGSVEHEGGTCRFTLTIPESGEMMIDLGELFCEKSP